MFDLFQSIKVDKPDEDVQEVRGTVLTPTRQIFVVTAVDCIESECVFIQPHSHLCDNDILSGGCVETVQ